MRLIYLTILLLFLNGFSLFAQEKSKGDTVSIKEEITNAVAESGKPELINYFTTSKILYTIFVLLVTIFATRVIIKILEVWAERNARHRITIKGLIPIARMLIWIATLVFVITFIFQPPLTTVLAFSASVGVAIGFAAQDSIKNIFGGITILFDRPYQVGDKVEIGGHYGEVIQVGLRATRLRTVDDNMIVIPNGQILTGFVSNANSSEQNLQVNTSIFLPVDFDIEFAKKTAYETAKVSRYVYLNKPISVFFKHEVIGQKLFLRMDVRAYVNDIRNEVHFRSEITEILSALLLSPEAGLNSKPESAPS